VEVKGGDRVPADIRIVTAHGFKAYIYLFGKFILNFLKLRWIIHH
jgi:hypothetical protein